MKFAHSAILASLAVIVTAYPIDQGTNIKEDSTAVNHHAFSIKRSPLEQAAQGDPQPYGAAHAAEPPKPEEEQKHVPTAPITPPPTAQYGKTPEKPATPQTPKEPEKQAPPAKPPQEMKYSPPKEMPHEEPKAPEPKQPEAPHAQPPAYVPPPSSYQSSSGAMPQQQDAHSSTPSGDHAAPGSGGIQPQQQSHSAPASSQMQHQQQSEGSGKGQDEGKSEGGNESEDEEDEDEEEGEEDEDANEKSEGKGEQEVHPAAAGASAAQPSEMHHEAPQHPPASNEVGAQAPSSNGYSQKDAPVEPVKQGYNGGGASDPHSGH